MKHKFLQLFVLIAAIGGAFAIATPAYAGTNDNVSGYGWSSTIGWISLNCTDPGTCASVDYGVKVDITQNSTQGNMDGYAWSPNIGWISFRPVDTANCPATPCIPHIDLATGIVTGWAKAKNGNPSSGWDGWIQLGGNTLAMNTTTGALTGFAWGSTVVGWVSFNGIVVLSPNQPALALTATPPTLVNPGPVTLNWTSANVQTASCSSTWAGGVSDIGTQVVQVSQTTTFTISCMGNNSAPISANATVTVTASSALILQANPMAVQSNSATTDLTWTSPNQTNFTSCTASASPSTSSWSGGIRQVEVPNAQNGYTHTKPSVTVPSQPNQSTTYTLTCLANLATSVSATAVVTVFAPTAAVSLAANPSMLPEGGGTSDLSWTTGNVTSCAASANPGGWSGAKNASGGSETVGVTTTTMFTITCQSPYSPPQVAASTTVYVAGTPLCSTCVAAPPPKPKFEEF